MLECFECAEDPRFLAWDGTQNYSLKLQCIVLGSGHGGEKSCGFQRQKSQRSGQIQNKKIQRSIYKMYFKINKLVEKVSRWQNHKLFIQIYLLIFWLISHPLLSHTVSASFPPSFSCDYMNTHTYMHENSAYIPEYRRIHFMHHALPPWVFHCTFLKKKQPLGRSTVLPFSKFNIWHKTFN